MPIADAVTFGDGRMILLDVATYNNGKTVVRPIAETTYDSFFTYNPGYFAEVTCFAEVPIPNGGSLQAGEGSQGADGFIALCDSSGELVYCIFSTQSNPFTKLALSEDLATVKAVSTADVEWSFAIATPWKIETRTLR